MTTLKKNYKHWKRHRKRRKSYHHYSLGRKLEALAILTRNKGSWVKTARETEISVSTLKSWKKKHLSKCGIINLEKIKDKKEELLNFEQMTFGKRESLDSKSHSLRGRNQYRSYTLAEKIDALTKLVLNEGNAGKTARETGIPVTTIITWKINYFGKQGKIDLEKWSQMLKEIENTESIIQFHKIYYHKNKDLIASQLQKSHIERYAKLSENEKKVIYYYLLLNRKQIKIANKLKLTPQRIGQLLNSAFIKLGLIFEEERQKKEWILFLRNRVYRPKKRGRITEL